MTVFIIVSEHDELGERVLREYPGDTLVVARGQWLVSDSGNARTVSEKLGLEKGSGFGGTLVFAISSYYGLHNSDIWDWIKSKLEAAP